MKKIYPFLLLASLLLFSCEGEDDYVPAEIDSENPSTPLNLSASNITQTSAVLNWNPATDNEVVVSYNLYKNGNLVQESIIETSITLSVLSIGAEYRYSVTAVDNSDNESNASNTLTFSTLPVTFKENLSEMNVFEGQLADLIPSNDVHLYELNTTLFTDYCQKQRLIRLPEGETMDYNNNDLLPLYPDNTLIAKTFYYNIDDRNPSLGKQLIETRILLKIDGNWQVGNYIWNDAQTDAIYRETGSEIPISYTNTQGNDINLNYIIPSKQECFNCHNNNDSTFPIGMKLRNMNFFPSYTNQNQLDYFNDNGLLSGIPGTSGISVLPDWTDDANYSLSERSRAYMDVNCAHCHQPGGFTPPVYEMDFRYETPFDESGIFDSRFGITSRFESTTPYYRMPQLGRTVVHEEALDMLTEYINSL